MLKDHSDSAAAQLSHGSIFLILQCFVLKQNFSGSHFAAVAENAKNAADQGAFSAAGFSHNPNNFSRLYLHAQVFDNGCFLVGNVQIGDLEQMGSLISKWVISRYL